MSKNRHHSNGNAINWNTVLPLLTVIFLTLGPTIALHVHLSSQTDAQLSGIRQEMGGIREEIGAIHNEMKDFHGRLERQDAEFKAHMIHFHENNMGR